eukprot:INCI598.1.p1 GENE.INCI598.1~~INCI598.1.p1  ORF type:complete len:367 (-),score=88.57 INCI598.1:600-1700(-)
MGLLIVMPVLVGRRRKTVEFFTESADTNVGALLQSLREAVPCRKKGKQYAFDLRSPLRDEPLGKDELLTDLFPSRGSVRLQVSMSVKDADASDPAVTPNAGRTAKVPVHATAHSSQDAHDNNEMPSPAATFDEAFKAPTLATPSTNKVAELQAHTGPDESDTQGHCPETKTSDDSPQAPMMPGGGGSADLGKDVVDGHDNKATADPNATAVTTTPTKTLSLAELQDQIETCEALGDAAAADTLREELAIVWMQEEIRILQAQQEAIEQYSDDYMLDDDLFAKHAALAERSQAIEAQEGEVRELVAKKTEAKRTLEDISSRIRSAGKSDTLLAEAQRARAVVKEPQQVVRKYVDQCGGGWVEVEGQV